MVTRWRQLFPKTKVKINLQNIQKLEQYWCKNLEKHQLMEYGPLYITLNHHQGINAGDFNGTVEIRKLIIHVKYGTFEPLCFQSLSKFKITKEFQIYMASNLKVAQSTKKCECPPIVIINCSWMKDDWADKSLQILNGFCKYGNINELQINKLDSENQNPPSIIKLYEKIGKFKNIQNLTLSFSCDLQVIQGIAFLLEQLKNVNHLTLQNCSKRDGILTAQSLAEILKTMISNMKELKTLTFKLAQPIKLMYIPCYKRAYPRIITIWNELQKLYVIDTKFGLIRTI
ncbi:hypothetical protein FGO68_gene17025 [Halteria grandinella]|uniref:Uncharacterized protein n=1 Tax=Halteria grandinella TaxID=5974 RepID=A0A8J8T423_HALGN|nr:hypothetical protein FGO68_gene17025 [Halteria grandinella]